MDVLPNIYSFLSQVDNLWRLMTVIVQMEKFIRCQFNSPDANILLDVNSG